MPQQTKQMVAMDEAAPLLAQDPVRKIWPELLDIMGLMGPIFISMVSWVGMKTTDTALVGHLNTTAYDGGYLAATALSDLWTSSTGVFIQGRVLGIFCGNAWGVAQTYREQGNEVEAKRSENLLGVWLQASGQFFCHRCPFFDGVNVSSIAPRPSHVRMYCQPQQRLPAHALVWSVI
jgi:hypothetical protein